MFNICIPFIEIIWNPLTFATSAHQIPVSGIRKNSVLLILQHDNIVDVIILKISFCIICFRFLVKIMQYEKQNVCVQIYNQATCFLLDAPKELENAGCRFIFNVPTCTYEKYEKVPLHFLL